jgi:phospholipid transport system substrate-binding protein
MRTFSPHRLPALFLFMCALAAIIFLGQAQAASSASGAKSYVESLSNQVINLLQSKVGDKEKEKKLSAIFENAVDTEWMGRFVMGQHYRKLTEDQKARYLELYKKYLLQSYVPRFREYTGEKIKINSVRDDKGQEFFVQTEILHPNGEASTLVDYRLRKQGEGYKIIDIIGEGISLITTQRSDFGGAITQGGVDAFLQKLQAKVSASNG